MVALEENKDGKQEQYVPYLQEEKTLEFIKEHQKNPFFLYLAYTPPHGKYIIPENDPVFKQYEGIPGGKMVQHYAAMITRTDQTIGKVLDMLKDLNLDEDTIIFYTSDNGPNTPFAKHINSGGGLRGIKRYLYEGGLRAAMAVRWPNNIPAGKVSDFVWDMRDFFPTACELAQTNSPEGLSGQSVLTTLKGGKQETRKFHYWEIHSPFQQAVRMGNWKAIRYGTKETMELYDLSQDVSESNDISGQHPEIIKEIEAFLETARSPSRYFPAREYAKKK
jgi:arylsulfatase A-like enzyme